jgi:hypothetical protein
VITSDSSLNPRVTGPPPKSQPGGRPCSIPVSTRFAVRPWEWEASASMAAAPCAVSGGLAEPRSTSGLAVPPGVSPSAVNQQLRLLRRTGLPTRRRRDRSVLYQRSALADALLLGRFVDGTDTAAR